jgi:uncharacterized HAD superfamily protein
MNAPGIYVDLDDVLARTVEELVGLVSRQLGRPVSVEEWTHFDPARAFGLEAPQLAALMVEAHEADVIERLEPVEGASDVLRGWVELGYRVSVVTGRPVSCRDATRRWLARHDVPHHAADFVDKYGRHEEGSGSLALEDVARSRFALAVEDSLDMALFLARGPAERVVLLDRPWNRTPDALPAEAEGRILRLEDWRQIGESFPAP